MSEKKFNIGLVLSGGGARGFAHLGVIEALNEAGIFPGVISGTSAGALAGVLYCDGYSPREILRMMNSHSRFDYVRPAVPRDGLLLITGIEKILEANLRSNTFEELKIPLYVAATDLNNGKAVYFSKGPLLGPVLASSSLPILFKPVVLDNIHYVDGGVLDNLPVKPVRNLCKLLIGSYVNPVGYEEKISGLIKIAERSFMLSLSKEVSAKWRKFNFFIAPLELRTYGILDPEKAEDMFEIGYKATQQELGCDRIKKLFSL
jgi:NTE family protein